MTEMKVAVVTGAAGGLGCAIVDRLIADGLRVAGLDVDAAGLESLGSHYGQAFLPCHCDLLDPIKISDAFVRVDEHFGGIDALVNNAGT